MRFSVLTSIALAMAAVEAAPVREYNNNDNTEVANSPSVGILASIANSLSALVGAEGTGAEDPEGEKWAKYGKEQGKKWKKFGKEQGKKWKKINKELQDAEDAEDSDCEELDLDEEDPEGEKWAKYGKEQGKKWKKFGKEQGKKWKKIGKELEDAEDSDFEELDDGEEPPKKNPWKNIGKDEKKKWKNIGKKYKKKFGAPKDAEMAEEEGVVIVFKELGPPPDPAECVGSEDPATCWAEFNEKEKKYWKAYGKEMKKKWSKPPMEEFELVA